MGQTFHIKKLKTSIVIRKIAPCEFSWGLFLNMKNTSKILRSKKSGSTPYTCISNEILQSKVISTDAKSVLVHLISLPETWTINKTTIWRLMNIGRERFKKAWIELEKEGYIVSKKLIGANNLIVGYNHIVYEVPVILISDSPESGLSEIQSTQEPVRKESNKVESIELESNEVENNNSTNTGTNAGVIPELDKSCAIEPSIEDLQAEYMNQSHDLYRVKADIIKASKFGSNVMSYINDLSKLERAIGRDKLEQIKPLIDQYFELELKGKQIWEKLNIAKEKKDTSNLNEVNQLVQDT